MRYKFLSQMELCKTYCALDEQAHTVGSSGASRDSAREAEIMSCFTKEVFPWHKGRDIPAPGLTLLPILHRSGWLAASRGYTGRLIILHTAQAQFPAISNFDFLSLNYGQMLN